MDWSILAEQLGEYGIVGAMILVALYFGYQELNKRDLLNKERVDDLKTDIRLMREERREESSLFRDSLESFNLTLNKISSVDHNVQTLNHKIDNLEVDVNYIKTNINK